jgi:enterochelin esterase family protein
MRAPRHVLLLRRDLLAATAALPTLRASSALGQNLRGDEALSKVLLDGPEGDWQLVAEGFKFTDAAASDADGNFYFSDLPAGVVYEVTPTGKRSVLWKDAPKVSGLELGPDGRFYAATQGNAAGERQLLAYDRKARAVTVLAEDVRPNDLAVTRKGLVYFTDTNAGEVHLVDDRGARRVVATGLVKPNGLSLTPDGGTLAVSEYGGEHVWAFRVEGDGALTSGSAWMDLRSPVGTTASGGDGMCCDVEGRFFVTSHLGVQMFDWTGRMGGVIAKPTGKAAVSCVFAGPARAYLYLCATDKVFRRKTKTTAPA